MPDITKDQLQAAAAAQCPALFKDKNPLMDEARANALGFTAKGLMAAGLTVEGYDDQDAAENQADS